MCDLKSRMDDCPASEDMVQDGRTRCAINDSLPAPASWATEGLETAGTMYLSRRDIRNREGMDVLQAPMRLGARLGGMGKITELLLNIVIK